MKLEQYLIECINKVSRGISIAEFIDLRYYNLSRLFPHKTFSVNQCSLDFFAESLDLLTGIKEFPKKEDYSSIYLDNYYNWLKYHKNL